MKVGSSLSKGSGNRYAVVYGGTLKNLKNSRNIVILNFYYTWLIPLLGLSRLSLLSEHHLIGRITGESRFPSTISDVDIIGEKPSETWFFDVFRLRAQLVCINFIEILFCLSLAELFFLYSPLFFFFKDFLVHFGVGEADTVENLFLLKIKDN